MAYDLIVMGNRGFGSFDVGGSGSVTEYMQENCSKPIIFAKGMPSDWDEENNFVSGANPWK